MLEHTFIHLPRIGAKTERNLWHNGVLCWNDLLRMAEDERSDLPFVKNMVGPLKDSIRHLNAEDPFYFAGNMPSAELWRLFLRFRRDVAYLDIETTGLGSSIDHITCLSLFSNGKVMHYVHGNNMDDFLRDVKRYKILVTFNGKTFDIPFIQREFNVQLPQIQIDLRYLLKSLGYSGGLKACEKQMGIERENLDGVDGYTAVLLWQEYKRTGNERALETLLAYNIEDTVNLEELLVFAYNKKLAGLPFNTDKAAHGPKPKNDYCVDKAILSGLIAKPVWPREFYV